MDHESHLCAALGHHISTVVAVWCPHRVQWTVVVREGDDADDTYLDSRTLEFGPFDSDEDVIGRTTSELTSMMRVGRRRWHAHRLER